MSRFCTKAPRELGRSAHPGPGPEGVVGHGGSEGLRRHRRAAPGRAPEGAPPLVGRAPRAGTGHSPAAGTERRASGSVFGHRRRAALAGVRGRPTRGARSSGAGDGKPRGRAGKERGRRRRRRRPRPEGASARADAGDGAAPARRSRCNGRHPRPGVRSLGRHPAERPRARTRAGAPSGPAGARAAGPGDRFRERPGPHPCSNTPCATSTASDSESTTTAPVASRRPRLCVPPVYSTARAPTA